MKSGERIRYLYINESGELEGQITGGKEGIEEIELNQHDVKRIKIHKLFSRWKTL